MHEQESQKSKIKEGVGLRRIFKQSRNVVIDETYIEKMNTKQRHDDGHKTFPFHLIDVLYHIRGEKSSEVCVNRSG